MGEGEQHNGEIFWNRWRSRVRNAELTPELAFKLGRYGGYVYCNKRKETHIRVSGA